METEELDASGALMPVAGTGSVRWLAGGSHQTSAPAANDTNGKGDQAAQLVMHISSTKRVVRASLTAVAVRRADHRLDGDVAVLEAGVWLGTVCVKRTQNCCLIG